MMFLTSTILHPPVSVNTNEKELLAIDDLEAHFRCDYTSLDVYAPLKAYLEQTNRWVYDGNGRWSTSDRMVRLRSYDNKCFLELWVISGDVQRVDKLEVDDTLISRLHRLKI